MPIVRDRPATHAPLSHPHGPHRPPPSRPPVPVRDAPAPVGPHQAPPRTPETAEQAHGRGNQAAPQAPHEYAQPTRPAHHTREARPPPAHLPPGQTPRENNLHGR